MNSNLDSVSIQRAKNGFTVRHNFKAKPVYRQGKNGGFGAEYNAPEEHVFGKDEGPKMMAHLGKVLGLQAAADAQADTRNGRGQGGFASQSKD